ncbi:hypothetical protein CROQUDRAFT_130962 [Cronartium quercuum f. sp. fusiforme G11]|uniref:C2H2-type domain-containing protein n=1 Tax=Cronartium quercuum f. sp. fusiforme G11 TaxID=708437 RepID=A0A9P6TEW8_9BASI|nr:hypothetical protein CROQUDRAFT_130962 [Cronartium quercuum f. sp. fusiforme G11]
MAASDLPTQTGSIPIASGSAHPSSAHSKISTSVQMSDGTCLPLSFRNPAFSRFSFGPNASDQLLPTGPSSVHMTSPPLGPSPCRLSTSLTNNACSFSLEAGFSLSPNAGFHPASFTGPGSFGASHLARMESAFCQNFVCCALPLRDLHDLLEHFEQAHCHAGDIVGVDGFEGVTLDQMAAGVGLSAELGLGPGTLPSDATSSSTDSNHRCRRRAGSRPPTTAHTFHDLRFEDEEEWSSGHDSSRSASPAHISGPITLPHSPAIRFDSEIEDNTMNRLGKTLRETLGTLRPIDRSRTSSGSRSRSDSLSGSQDGRLGTGTDRALSELIASFRSKACPERHRDQFASSGLSKQDINRAYTVQMGVAPSDLESEHLEGGAIDPAVLLEGHSFDEPASSDDAYAHLQLDPQALIQHHQQQQQQRRRRRPNIDPVTGLTPTGRLPRPWMPASEKPFKCSVPGCEKAYKQQNGLKYHKTHGHSPQTILTAEEESKAFVCHDLVCGKRYKNMNGLRYHYQHTGPHGALGIQLLSLGVHPPPQYPAGHKKASLVAALGSAGPPSSPPSFG